MRLCAEHWTQLRAEIDQRGLGGFVAKDGAAVAENIVSQLAGAPPNAAPFDPLLNANFAIWSNALQMGGLYLMTMDDAGHPRCPICESERHDGHPAEWWIDHAVTEQFNKAKALGLVKVQ